MDFSIAFAAPAMILEVESEEDEMEGGRMTEGRGSSKVGICEGSAGVLPSIPGMLAPAQGVSELRYADAERRLWNG